MQYFSGLRNNGIVFFFMLMLAVACKEHVDSQKPLTHIAIARSQVSTVHFYYSGTLLPLHSTNVVSPVEGVVKKIHFHYGGEVAAKQLLVEVGSPQAKKEYASALTNYIKDKDEYLRRKRSFEATSALYLANITDQESYLNEKSQFQSSQLVYVNSANILKNMAQILPGQNQNIDTLSLGNLSDIQIMLANIPDEFKIYAPIAGIVLSPLKSAAGDADNDSEKALHEGSKVKKYQPLLSVGDMTGVTTVVNVSEMDINQIKLQQLALLTSPALPGMVLHGQVSDISQQAKSSETGGELAIFPVQVSVPDITPRQRRLIRVGMTVKVDIALSKPGQIKIPITAVLEKNGGYFVEVVDAKTKKPQAVAVETGATDLSDVVILNGLRVGEPVVLHD